MEILSVTEIALCVWGVVVSMLCSYYYAELHAVRTTAITPRQLKLLIRHDPEVRDALREMIDLADNRPTS